MEKVRNDHKGKGEGVRMIQLEPKIVFQEEVKVIGISAQTSNADEVGGNGKIPALWGEYFQKQIGASIPNRLADSPTIGLYTDYEDGVTGTYAVLIGMKVETIDEIPNGLVGKAIPAGKYAVFTTEKGNFARVVPEAWAFIWDWFSRNDLKRTFTGDYELYDSRANNPEEAVVDIYIAVE